MKRKRIALFFLGGTISTYRDSKTGGVFSLQKKEELAQFLPDLETEFDVTLYSHILEKKFFLDINDWGTAHKFLQEKAEKFDGFVIAQETDSLLQGSSFFGLMNAALKIPVVFTASVVPFGAKIGGQIAEKNMMSALQFAASDLGETCVYAHRKLIRATRAKRRNIEDPTPFFSGQVDDLGGKKETGEMFLNIHREKRNDIQKEFPFIIPQKNIIFLEIFPGYPGKCLQYLKTQKNIDALVIGSLGYGSLRDDLVTRLEKFVEVGVPVVIIAEHDSANRKFFLDADTSKGDYTKMLLVRNITKWTTFCKAYIAAQNTDSTENFYAFMEKSIAREVTI